jgi:hypothetical protein
MARRGPPQVASQPQAAAFVAGFLEDSALRRLLTPNVTLAGISTAGLGRAGCPASAAEFGARPRRPPAPTLAHKGADLAWKALLLPPAACCGHTSPPVAACRLPAAATAASRLLWRPRGCCGGPAWRAARERVGASPPAGAC